MEPAYTGSFIGKMFEIVTCFQVVPDASMALSENWSVDPAVCLGGSLKRIFDYYDEAALEMGLRLKERMEKADKKTLLRAITVTPFSGDARMYERLFALGYEQVMRIECEAEMLFSPIAKANLIAGYLKQTKIPDYVLCGAQSSLGGSRQTGPALAEFLGLTCVSNVREIEISDTGLKAIMSYDNTIAKSVLPEKCVILIGNSDSCYMRVPTLKAKLAVRGKAAEVISMDAAEAVKEARPFAVNRPESKHLCTFIDGTTREQAEEILRQMGGDKV